MQKNIGRFEIRGELGRGAQSVVYLAWDPQLQREVAIKTLHFSRADPTRNARLLEEARMVGRFRHPHVVPIYDAGEQDGDPYLVFERVVGRNLADALKSDGPLPTIRAATLMLQIADVLVDAHALGIIHRDLKPSNILLDARDGAPRVMDFGIASQVSAGGKPDGEALTGTPPYLAPEYITLQRVTPQVDVFAAGLVLLEMLTGKRVFEGGTVDSILYRIACEPVTLPKEPAIDPRLGGIILRACALDPSRRYTGAAELRDALNGFLGDGVVDRGADQTTQGDTLEFLLRRMRHKSDFPALSDSVSAINKLTHAQGESVSALSNTILKDYALTNKILRLVNSAYYRQVGGGNISTVSRAVIVLGFDIIRNIALTVLLFEHLQDKANAHELKEAFLRANLAGLVAKDICQSPLLGRQGEEAFICALFHGLGKLLAQYYFPEEVEEINKLVQYRKLSERSAATAILGISYDDLGIGIAGNWGFPPTIIDSMRPLPAADLRKPNTTGEALRVAAAFGNELCDLVSVTPPEQRDMVLRKISQRFGASLQVSDRQVQATVEKSVVELTQLAAVLRVNVRQSSFARRVAAFASGAADAEKGLLPPVAAEIDHLADTLLGDSALLDGLEDTAIAGVPDDAQAVLTAGIQDISNSLVDDFALNDILRIILETIYRAMGFKRVLLALRDTKSGRMTGRFGLGPDVNDLVRQFRFPLSSLVNDVFLLATGRGVDIIISDIDDPKIADKVPQWFRERVTAKTFVLFPLNLKGKPVALIYCDKDKPGSINIPEKELTLLKTLRNQALLAIKQAT